MWEYKKSLISKDVRDLYIFVQRINSIKYLSKKPTFDKFIFKKNKKKRAPFRYFVCYIVFGCSKTV